MAALQTPDDSVLAKADQAAAAAGGAADTKAVAETALEDLTYVLARALAVQFKKIGNLTARAQVDVSKSDLVKLRTQELVNKTTAIRDLGTAAVGDTDAAKRGVTAPRIAAVTAAITAFSNVMNSPRGEIVNRSALLREIETDIAALLVAVNDLDDLALQFDGTDEGKRFIEAWKRARIIVDSGTGQLAPAPTPPPPTPPPAPNPQCRQRQSRILGQFWLVEDRSLNIPDAAHRDRSTMQWLTTDPQAIRRLGAHWQPPQHTTTAYELFIELPYVDGHCLMRTWHGQVVGYNSRAAGK